MRRLYDFLALLIVLLGMIHIVATAMLFASFNSRALWFASAGLLLVLTGALNLLNRAYGSRALGLRLTTVGANAVMTAFAVLAGIVGAAAGLQMVAIFGLLAATTVVSLIRRFSS